MWGWQVFTVKVYAKWDDSHYKLRYGCVQPRKCYSEVYCHTLHVYQSLVYAPMVRYTSVASSPHCTMSVCINIHCIAASVLHCTDTSLCWCLTAYRLTYACTTMGLALHLVSQPYVTRDTQKMLLSCCKLLTLDSVLLRKRAGDNSST